MNSASGEAVERASVLLEPGIIKFALDISSQCVFDEPFFVNTLEPPPDVAGHLSAKTVRVCLGTPPGESNRNPRNDFGREPFSIERAVRIEVLLRADGRPPGGRYRGSAIASEKSSQRIASKWEEPARS